MQSNLDDLPVGGGGGTQKSAAMQDEFANPST